MTEARLPRLGGVLERGVAEGLHPGAVARVERLGESGGWSSELAVGEARPGEAMRGDHLVAWMSVSKPVTTMAVALLVAWGELALETRVAAVVPEFGAAEKGEITIEQLLTHTAGLKATAYQFPEDDWPTILRGICKTPVEAGWSVGEDAGYSQQSNWFVLGEVVQRVSGEGLSGFLRREVLEPMGATDAWVGMPGEVYESVSERVCPVYDMARGGRIDMGMARREVVTACRPGGGAVGTIGDMASFYGGLLGVLKGWRAGPWSAETVRDFVSRRRRDTFDQTFRHTMDWGLGFMVNSSRHGVKTVPYGFGPGASDEAFGHGGYQSSIAFADPARDLVVAIVCNGCPGEPKHQRRMREALAALEEDLAEQGVGDGAGRGG